jgi:halimadienyl-diphosphate synthase
MINVESEIQKLLKEIGPGRMSSTAYDTAWVARLGDVDQDLSHQAMEWLSENQLPDGSWGAKDIFYYHDRVISTLAAMIALTQHGRRTHDKLQIEKGLLALEHITSGATQGLASDPNGATVGFEMIAPTLVAEAEKLGIIKQQGDRILGRMRYLREKKMRKLTGVRISRYYTPAFSAEMAGEDGKSILDFDNLQESNGSVANSPSATAYFAHQIKTGDKKSLHYLRKTIEGRTGGAPFASPFNIFERAWVLWNLSLVPNFINNIDMQKEIIPHVDFMSSAWRDGQGVGFSSEYTPCDSDDTSVAFDVLKRFHREKNIQTLLNYEEEEYFRCYPLEANPSIGANVHILSALRQSGIDKRHPAILKILSFLLKTCQPEGYWVDKWHISPYYITSHVAIVCRDMDVNIHGKALKWILETQKHDGSWGSFGISTAEETAYALQALKLQNNIVYRTSIKRGVEWLKAHWLDPYPNLWISKALYCPEIVVRSTILSALSLCEE